MLSNSKEIVYLDPKLIKVPTLCKRKKEDILSESVFARGIKTTDIHEPFLVIKSGRAYELVDGARRFKTAVQLGKKKIPCIIDEGYDDSYGSKARYRNYLRFVVNYHRQDLPKSQKIYFINMAIRKYKLKLVDIAKILGISETTLKKHLELNEASEEIKELVDSNIISITSAAKLKKLNKHGLKRVMGQVDTTARVTDKAVNYLVKDLDPEVHYTEPDVARRMRRRRRKMASKPLASRYKTKVSGKSNKMMLDDMMLQEEKKDQLDNQARLFRQDFAVVYPIIKAILKSKKITKAIDRKTIQGFKNFVKYQEA